jgi:hypothetical protein
MSEGYRVLLRNNLTGIECWYETEVPWGEGSHFLWTEGNYSCDCNRHIFFEAVAGLDTDDCPCGEARYTAVCAELTNGERIVLDERT